MALHVYNTLTRKKDEFKPLQGKKVNMFVCGPTVYGDGHIGHGKTYVQFDVIVKYLRKKGFDVFYLMNITDIDDKIINKANSLSKDWDEVAREFEKKFYEDMNKLGNDAVDEYARATDFMKAIIKQIKDLLEKGYAYETSDGIYFEIDKFKEYGKLSKQDLSQIRKGARVEVNEDKKDHSDFVLWKKHKPEEPFWESPWGKGRPGWHIEDTAITETKFGVQYDLHGGAMDLIFPHHECEIAQMEAASGKKPLVKYWLHTAFLNLDKDKMSKSLGNIIPIKEAIDKWGSKTLRYYYAVNHYRTPIDYSDENVQHAKNALETLNNFIQDVLNNNGKDNEKVDSLVKELLSNFEKAMDNDFDTAGAIAKVFDFVHEINKLEFSKKDSNKIINALKEIDSVFNFFNFKEVSVPKEIQELVDKREEARKNKDFKLSDKLRDEIKNKGYLVEDTSQGARVKKN